MSCIAILLIFGAGPPMSLDSQLSSDELDTYTNKVCNTRKACGPLALWCCLQLQGKNSITKEEVLAGIEISEHGVSLAELVAQSKRLGLTCRAIKVQPADLMKLPWPAILVVGDTHCVVLIGLNDDNRKAAIFDPSSSSFFMPRVVELEKYVTGQAIVFDDARLSHLNFIICTIAACCAELFLVVLMRSFIGK